jgi:hypothetical protein
MEAQEADEPAAKEKVPSSFLLSILVQNLGGFSRYSLVKTLTATIVGQLKFSASYVFFCKAFSEIPLLYMYKFDELTMVLTSAHTMLTYGTKLKTGMLPLFQPPSI